GVLVAGGKGAGDAPHRAAVHDRCAMNLFAFALFLRAHFAGRVDLWPGNVAVHVDAARHYHETRSIERSCRPNRWVARRLNNLAAADPEVLHLAINAIGGIIDVAARDEEIVE